MTIDREGSLDAFRRRFPDLADRLERPAAGLEDIREDGVLVDLSLDGKRFYGGDGRALAELQVDAYLREPHRFALESPESLGLSSPLALRMTRYLDSCRLAMESRGFPIFPLRGRNFLFVYGIGLGHALERLVQETRPAFILFVEPMVEVLGRSLEVVDWSGLFERLDRDKVRYEFVIADDPKVIHARLQLFAELHGPGFLDGAFVYQHYGLWSLTEAKQMLLDRMYELFLAVGFFEDEVVMIRNTVANLTGRSGGLLDGRPRVERHEPVFIVGSGPSLDDALPAIRSLREQALVVSCGTALSILLRNGIVPDFHVELENVPAVHGIIARVAAAHDLSAVRLLAATSVDPGVADLFGQADFFLRDAISSTKIIRGALQELYGVAPTCVNSALSCFSILGFQEFHLFGVDCGRRVDRSHHAQGSVYHEIGLKDDHFDYPLQVAANFGGQAEASWVLELSRMMLTQVIRNRLITVFNCSDGALIEDTVPRLPEAVRLNAPPLDREGLKAEIDRRLVAFDGDRLLQEANLPGLLADASSIVAGVEAILQEAETEDEPFSVSFARLHVFLARAEVAQPGAHATMSGSIRALARVGMYFGTRVGDDLLHRRFYQLYRDEMGRSLRHMRREIGRIVESVGPNAVGKLAKN